jgi:hypothetical protein
MEELPKDGVSGVDVGTVTVGSTPLIPPVLAATAALPPVLGSRPTSPIWGAWATLGLGLTILLGHVMGQSMGVMPFVLVSALRGHPLDAAALGTNGLVLAVATLVAAPVSVGLAFLFAWLKARSWAAACAYLGLRAVPMRAYLWALLTFGVVLLSWAGYSRMLHMPDVPQVMVDMYRTAGVYPVFWAALILAAPVAEEVIFRGFFFTGLHQSRVGALGAIALPSVFWAAIHVQYGIREIGFIFLFGLALGALRWKTNSLWPPMVVHAVSNLLSTMEVAGLAGTGG